MNTAFCRFASALCLVFFAAHSQAATLLFETEEFQFKGDWYKANFPNEREFVLEGGTSRFTPTTLIPIKEAGNYYVWVNSVDFEKLSPRTRIFSVEIDGKALEKRGGMHGCDGLRWEKLGEMELSAGDHLLQIKPLAGFSRTDAFIFTTDKNFNPSGLKKSDRKKIKAAHGEIKYTLENYFIDLKPLKDVENPDMVFINNADCKIVFTEKEGDGGKNFYERSAKILKDGKWIKLPPFKDELFFILYDESAELSDRSYFSTWKKSNARIIAEVNKKPINLALSPINPYAVGQVSPMRISQVKKKNSRAAEIVFENGAKATIKLPKKGQYAKVDISYKADKDGYYSMGLKSFNEVPKDKVKAAFMPTPYQGRRLMKEPRMMTTTLLSKPISIIEREVDSVSFTTGVAANPDYLPFEWSRHGGGVYGFSLAAPSYNPQSAIFQPILGGVNSKKKKGETVEASWYMLHVAGDWCDALELIDTKIFTAAAELRESFGTSFSDALANIAQYLKDGEYSGWSPKHKARWNIEGDDLSTHSSPLAEVEAALLLNDEDYYKDIALPTIEYTLSRRAAHFRTFKTDETAYGLNLHELKVPGNIWMADYYASLDSLLGGKNKWLYGLAKTPDGKLNFRDSSTPMWTQKLGYYIANPSPELLEEIKADCDKWIEKNFEAGYSYDVNFQSFINYGLYPYWWYLPELYKATNDKKYLDYAEKGAFFSMSALWDFPAPPKGKITINKDNFSCGISHIWWKGREHYRHGADISIAAAKTLKDANLAKQNLPFFIPEKQVEAKLVSRIGVGIEQHSTYMGLLSNIIMPSWANEMLKVYQLTGRDVLMKFSRHSIIGRYANFFGYYINGFTDIAHDSRYPYMGPDITSFYFHHAPCHFAQTADYLFAQIEVATGDRISFPYVRQQGYVWFTDRIFGKSGGKVFEDADCRPILDKRAVRPDSPKVSTLLARSKNTVWAILYNDSANKISTSVKFDSLSKTMKDALADEVIESYDVAGNKLPQTYTFYGDKIVDIEPMSVVALKIPAKDCEDPSSKLGELGEDAHICVDASKLPKGWGEMHAFRIRGPFGKDSIYVVFTGGFESEDAKIALNMKSPQSLVTRDYYPYEISVYPLSPESDIIFDVSVFESGKLLWKSEELTLKK